MELNEAVMILLAAAVDNNREFHWCRSDQEEWIQINNKPLGSDDSEQRQFVDAAEFAENQGWAQTVDNRFLYRITVQGKEQLRDHPDNARRRDFVAALLEAAAENNNEFQWWKSNQGDWIRAGNTDLGENAADKALFVEAAEVLEEQKWSRTDDGRFLYTLTIQGKQQVPKG